MPVPAWKAIASPATARPTTGVSNSFRGSIRPCRVRASRWMPAPSSAAPTPMAIAHPNSAASGRTNRGRSGIARENVPSPVHVPSPTKMRVPVPAATRPGNSTRSMTAPPSPAASIRRKAPRIGEPNRVLIAAKLPAAATAALVWSGASRFASCTAHTPSPAPRAISGASGPMTTPNARLARAAKKTPGSSIGVGAPPALNPSAGLWPPIPGRYWIVERDQHPGERQQRDGPPGRLLAQTEGVREVGEDLALEDIDELEEAPRRGGDGHPDDPGNDQEAHVATRAQQGERVGDRRHRPRGSRLVAAPATRCVSPAFTILCPFCRKPRHSTPACERPSQIFAVRRRAVVTQAG